MSARDSRVTASSSTTNTVVPVKAPALICSAAGAFFGIRSKSDAKARAAALRTAVPRRWYPVSITLVRSPVFCIFPYDGCRSDGEARRRQAPPAAGLAIDRALHSIDCLLRGIFYVAGGLVDPSFALQLSVAREGTERFLDSTFRPICRSTHRPLPSRPPTGLRFTEAASNVPSQCCTASKYRRRERGKFLPIRGKSFRAFLEIRSILVVRTVAASVVTIPVRRSVSPAVKPRLCRMVRPEVRWSSGGTPSALPDRQRRNSAH